MLARQAEIAAAAAEREKQARREARKGRLTPSTPKVPRLVWRSALVVIAAEALTWLFVTGALARVAVAVLAVATFLVFSTARSPSR